MQPKLQKLSNYLKQPKESAASRKVYQNAKKKSIIFHVSLEILQIQYLELLLACQAVPDHSHMTKSNICTYVCLSICKEYTS